MAKLPKDVSIKITPVVDTEGLAKLQATLAHIGAGFAQTAAEMKPVFDSMAENLAKTWEQMMPKPKPITPEQIAHVYGVPPDLIDLLPPDAGETIIQAVFDGTLTGEAYVLHTDGGVLTNWPNSWKDHSIHAGDDTGVLPMGQCPSNVSPYVPGHLGPTAMLVNQQPTGWAGKSTAEIMADIQAAADLYAGKITMPKKTFKAPEPGKGSGIPAHAVFTSPLIHSHEEATATAQDQLAKHGIKASGPVKVQKLDKKGNPTGEWFTLGQVQDFNLEPLLEQIYDDQPMKTMAETYTIDFPLPDPMPQSLASAMVEAQLKDQAEAEKHLLGAYIGVDVSSESGNTVTVQTNPAESFGTVQVSVYGPDGTPIKQQVLTQADVGYLAAKLSHYPPMVGQAWHDGMGQPVAEDVQVSEDDHGVSIMGGVLKKPPLSMHAMGTAIDINGLTANGGWSASPDHMHFEVGNMATGQPVNLGHTEVVAEAVEQHQAVSALQDKIKKKGGIKFGEGTFSKTFKQMDNGSTLVAYPDGVSTVQLPGTVHTPGGMWANKIDYKGTFPTEVAQKIVGMVPVEPGEALPVVQQWVSGKPFCWHPEHGWMPQEDFDLAVSTAPPTTWFGEDGQPLPTEDDLFTEETPHASKFGDKLGDRLWCTFHGAHWDDPTHPVGKVFQCGSSTWTRESTPLEDKQVLAKIQMMHDTGLL